MCWQWLQYSVAYDQAGTTALPCHKCYSSKKRETLYIMFMSCRYGRITKNNCFKFTYWHIVFSLDLYFGDFTVAVNMVHLFFKYWFDTNRLVYCLITDFITFLYLNWTSQNCNSYIQLGKFGMFLDSFVILSLIISGRRFFRIPVVQWYSQQYAILFIQSVCT